MKCSAFLIVSRQALSIECSVAVPADHSVTERSTYIHIKIYETSCNDFIVEGANHLQFTFCSVPYTAIYIILGIENLT